MNREEILSRSRKENKEQDLYKIEVQVQAGNIGSQTATLLATFFFVTEALIGKGFDFGLYAIILSVFAASFIFKAIRLKYRKEIILATVFTLATLILSTAHIITLTKDLVW
ncbi:DUF6442 family protein [Paenibacillus brevis]|uniref:DUF6442 family protein n=1 Tax=Paenibacillus brevis TaxID=2841508 RepID=UPI003D2F2D4B